MTSLPLVLRDGQVLRAELAVIGVVHLMLGAVIAWAPRDIIVTTGSMPVFTVLPSVFDVDEARAGWGVSYALCGLFVLLLASRLNSVLLMHITWPTVGFTNMMWAGVFIAAAFHGVGSALGAVIFMVPLLWSGFAGWRVAQGTGGTGVATRSGGTAGRPR